MKLPFRQGIVDAQKNGLGQPQFLLRSGTPGYVTLAAELTALTINVAHGSSDYLVTFNQNVDPAWGPVVPGVDNYLYWDIDNLTAEVTYGITLPPPIASTIEPTTPQVDQHWYDLSTTTMKVWNGAKWITRIRLFAGKIPNGVLTGVESSWCYGLYQPWVLAEQLQVESNPGYITTNIYGQPQYLSGTSLEFMTAKTPVRYISQVGTVGVLSQPTNAIFPVRASQSIPAMSVVYFSGENEVGLASGNPSVNPVRIPVGIIQSGLMAGEIGILHQSGEISNDQWDWSSHIGKPLYCGEFGELVTYRPAGLLAYRVGFVKSRNTIVFHIDAETLPQVYSAGDSDVVVSGTAPVQTSFSVSGIGEKIWNVSIPAATASSAGHMTAAQAAAVQSHATRLTQAEADILNRSIIGHTHDIANVTGLQAALDMKSPLGHTHTEYSTTTHNHDGYHALAVHSHTIPDVAGLQVELNGKAPLVHTHSIANVTGLQVAIDSKVDKLPAAVDGNFAAFAADGGLIDSNVSLSSLSTMFAFANHTHSIAHVTGLQTALDGKAAVTHDHDADYADINHVHSINQLTDVDTATTAPTVADALIWNGTQWVPGAINNTPSLPTEIVVLGAPSAGSTFTLRTTQAAMAFWGVYEADQEGSGLSEWTGTFDAASVAGEPTVQFPTPYKLEFTGLAISIAALGTAPAMGANATAVEVVIDTMTTSFPHQLFVGYFFPVLPFNPFDIYGGPGGSAYWSNSSQSGIQGYGGGGSLSTTVPWQSGDVIGLVLKSSGSTMDLYKNGVLVGQLPVISSPGGYVMVGGYTPS